MANRGMSAEVLAEIAKGNVKTCLLVEFYFDSGTDYVAMCGVPITWGGNTYQPGHMLTISPVEESLEARVGTVNFEVTGVPISRVAQAMTEEWVDRRVVIRRALIDADMTVIADPVELFDGLFSSEPTIVEDYFASTATVKWQAASHWADFERVAGRRTNNEDQQTYFPADKGFEFATANIDEIRWGKE